MSDEPDTHKLKIVLLAGGLFFISCFMCYDELAYQISGREGEATVTKSYPTGRRGNTSVEYNWMEPDGTQRRAMYTTDPSNALQPGTKIPIRYTPGEDGRSRLLGNVPWVWITIFVASLVGIGVFGYLLWREGKEAYEPRKRSR